MATQAIDPMEFPLYHYTSFAAAMQIIITNSLKTSRMEHTNDPFECTPEIIPDEKDPMTNEIFRELSTQYFRFISFSKNPNSLAMWAHYAEKHQGVLFEFNKNSKIFQHLNETLICKPREVSYDKKRAQFCQKTWQDKKTPRDAKDELIMKVFTTKEESWAYEKELRIFFLCDFKYSTDTFSKDSNSDMFIRLGPDAIASIFCGCNMSDTNLNTLNTLVDLRWQNDSTLRPRVKRLILNKDSYGFDEWETKEI